MNLSKRVSAEFLGTFWLVFGGCGSAVLAAAFPQLGIGFYGVALAFGLTVLTMAYAVGHISGCHLNPAVSFGLVTGKRFPIAELLPYVIAQVVGGILGAGVLYVIASGKAGFDLSGGFASNGYAAHSPGGYSLVSCFVAEVVLTCFFLLIIMGATDRRAPSGLMGPRTTLVVLAGADHRRRAGRSPVRSDLRVRIESVANTSSRHDKDSICCIEIKRLLDAKRLNSGWNIDRRVTLIWRLYVDAEPLFLCNHLLHASLRNRHHGSGASSCAYVGLRRSARPQQLG
jgi:MIP family channel proteins